MSITALRAVELGVPDLDAASAFYENAWGLSEVARSDDARYLRAAGPEHHIVVLHRRAERGLIAVDLRAGDAAAVDRLYASVNDSGIAAPERPHALSTPGGGYGFAFTDREGRTFHVASDVGTHADAGVPTDRPERLSHIVLNSTDADAMTRLFTERLGFRLRDRTVAMDFLGCNDDHHSVAFVRTGVTGLNHIAFELPSIDAVMRGAGRLKQHGFRIEWGVGRHGPGANVFAYFIDPHDYAIEYTAEMQRVNDATYHFSGPEIWSQRKGLDAWGLADPPSERFRAVSSIPAR